MYRLMISFKKADYTKDVWSQQKEYLLADEVEVCKVITKLSHLEPIITLCSIPVLNGDDVLKDFELKEV